MTDCRLLFELPHHRALQFSPDGKLLAVKDEKGSVQLRDCDTGLERTVLTQTGELSGGISFTPDSRRIAFTRHDGAIRMYDILTGEETLTIPGFHEKNAGATFRSARDVAFSPDGYVMATTQDYGGAVLWDVRPESTELEAERDAIMFIRLHCGGRISLEQLYAEIGSSTSLSDAARQRTLALAKTYWDRLMRREASEIVHHLYQQWRIKPEVIRAVHADVALPPWLREYVLEALEEQLEDEPSDLDIVAWSIVSKPDKSPFECAEALGYAEKASRARPDWQYRITLGVAQYRCGEYEKCIVTLKEFTYPERSEDPRPDDLIGQLRLWRNAFLGGGLSLPANSPDVNATAAAFLAMAHHRLGHATQENKYLDRLRKELLLVRWQNDVEAQGFLREAEALIEDIRK